MTSSLIGRQAIVIGAGMAGLPAARALADYFEQVVVLERDPLPPGASHRARQVTPAPSCVTAAKECVKKLYRSPFISPPRGRPGPIVPRHGPSKIGKMLPMLETLNVAEEWVPAFAGMATTIPSPPLRRFRATRPASAALGACFSGHDEEAQRCQALEACH